MFAFAVAFAFATHAAPPAGYQLVWSDEFDGNALDTGRWTYWLTGTRRDAVNTPSAVTVSNGILTITTFTSNSTHYTGMVSTDGKYYPTYGYIEASINFDSSPGMWSAFWLQSPGMGGDIGNPAKAGNETDICEHRRQDSGGNNIDGNVQINIHWDGYGGSHKSQGSGNVGSGLGSGYHTYAVWWTPWAESFYIDGTYVYGFNYPVSARSEFLILSSEVQNGSWAGNIPGGGYGSFVSSTTKMKVDYVRVYQLPPTMTALADRSATAGEPLSPLRFSVDDDERAAYNIAVTVTALNSVLLPPTAFNVSGNSNPWTSQDIGAVGAAGSTHISGSGITIVGSGADVWGTNDEFRFVSQPLSGDGDLRVRVRRLQNTDAKAKAGIMIRESAATNAPYAFAFATPASGISYEYRTTGGGRASESANVTGVAAPYWLRLVRVGHTFTAYRASDNNGNPNAWSQLGAPQVIPMSNDVRIGLAVCSHNDGTLCNALFTDPAGTTTHGGERVLAIAPAPDRSGATTVTVVANDGELAVTNRFDVAIAGTPRPAEFISAAAAWRYLDTGAVPPANWTAAEFDDSAWPEGEAQLGFGDDDEVTAVNTNRTRITTYFRRAFNVSDPLAWPGLRLDLLRDDGAVVYLNGTEVFRSNMPGGPIGPTTQAAAATAGDDETTTFYSASVNASLLRAGTNVVAVEVHQFGTNSSDLSFNLRLAGTHPVPSTLVARSSAWRYLDNGVFPGASWTSLDFNDDAWRSGTAQLGYGDDDETTVVNFGPDANNKYVTTWFRRTFVVSNAADLRYAFIRLLRDDGAVVYLNGTEILRSNLPTNGAITPTTLASSAVSGAQEEQWFESAVNASLLVPGTNAIAVEVHQSATNSSDVSYDMELVAYPAASLPALQIAGGTATWPAWARAYALFTTTNLTPPSTWTPVTNGIVTTNGRSSVLPLDATMRFYQLRK